jgi:hypothetical protein
MAARAKDCDDRRGTVPARPSRANLREAVQGCRACELWRGATQAVSGEGARDAEVMLVGEQPGDREDIEGRPFVGRPDACSMRLLNVPRSSAATSTSRTSSSTFATRPEASGVSIRDPIGRTLRGIGRADAMDAFVGDLANVRSWLRAR